MSIGAVWKTAHITVSPGVIEGTDWLDAVDYTDETAIFDVDDLLSTLEEVEEEGELSEEDAELLQAARLASEAGCFRVEFKESRRQIQAPTIRSIHSTGNISVPDKAIRAIDYFVPLEVTENGAIYDVDDLLQVLSEVEADGEMGDGERVILSAARLAKTSGLRDVQLISR